jgi:transmembrane sensor
MSDGGADGVEDQAIAWLVRLSADDAGAGDWRAHEAWLAADPAHPAAFDRIEALWFELGEQAETLKQGLDAADAGGVVIPLRPRPRPEPRRPVRAYWAAAAALALMVGGGGLYAALKASPATYQTAPGQIRRIDLADGSRIDLNGASRLAVRFDRSARRVTMADAEALFDVAKDPARPFLITAGRERIRVVGTAFDVASHAGQVTVTVRRGVVEVGRAGADGALGEVSRVPAGFQLIRRDGEAAALIRAVDPNDAAAWRERRLVYHGQTLASVADDLGRAFARPIAVRGPARALPFSGVLVLDDEDAVVRRLQAFLPLEVDRSGDGIVLSSRP